MMMKRYIVTEAELRAFCIAAADSSSFKEWMEAWDVCTARPVPDWATEFAGDPHNVGYVESWEFEEIPK